MKRLASRQRSISGTLHTLSRQTVEFELLASPSIEAKAVHFLASRGGSLWAMILFVIALGAWLYVGQHGLSLQRFHVPAFDPSPFKMLELILKVIAAVWATTILIILDRLPGRNEFRTRARMKLLDRFQLIGGTLDHQTDRIRHPGFRQTKTHSPDGARQR